MFEMAAVAESEPLSEFTGNPDRFLGQLLTTREPIRFHASDSQEIVIVDANSYDELLRKLDRVAAISAVAQSLQEFNVGQGRPFRDVMEELSLKHNLSTSCPE